MKPMRPFILYRWRSTLIPALAVVAVVAWVQAQESGAKESATQEGSPERDAAASDVGSLFAKAGILLDAPGQALAFPAAIEVRRDALEYLLVNPVGAYHESLFVSGVDAKILAAAFLAAGAEPGTNVTYVEKDPVPTEEELRAGARTHDVVPPSGKPIFLYAAWREAAGGPGEGAETTYLHRVEDLVLDLQRDRTMRRHGLVWLGSRMLPASGDAVPPRFAARSTGNLASLTFFADGDALMTTALPECASQTNWYPNGWLLPPPKSEVLLIASHREIESVPEAFRAALPLVSATEAGADAQR